MKIRRTFLTAALVAICLTAAAQTKWYDPLDGTEPHVQGRAWNAETGKNYCRLPERAKPMLRKDVWNLSRCSSGLYIDIFTNANSLTILYTVEGGKFGTNVPSFTQSGLDVYKINKDGAQKWLNTFGHYNFGKATNDTLVWTYKNLKSSLKYGDEYRIYLPMYSVVKSMSIGVPEGSNFSFAPQRIEKPIVIYGTSIAQGASPTRPANAWPNIVERKLDMPVVDLAFSGNGRLESGVFSLLSEINAKAYILDCLPNMSARIDSIVPRTIAGVKMLRAKNNAPIILTADVWNNYERDYLIPRIDSCQQAAVKQLKELGFKDIYYISKKDLDITEDDYADGSHPNDIGMMKYANAYIKTLCEALNMHPMDKFKPLRQRREPNVYEWTERHNDVLMRNRTIDPQVVLIGNSITHYWAGEPSHPQHRGVKAWNKLFGKKRVTNMGFGWDRIENVTWRLYNDELDDCHPQDIFLMLGTNNIGLNTDSDIADGVAWVVNLIRQKQPQARIHVELIYPRRNREQKVADINKLISERVKTDDKTDIIDVSNALLLTDGSGKIDEKLFVDGLHPNEDGYLRIADVLKPYLKKK
jgi:lysophospholipase L1-like esterase